MIEVATSPERYILDDDTETGKFMDYVYETYGYPELSGSSTHWAKEGKQNE